MDCIDAELRRRDELAAIEWQEKQLARLNAERAAEPEPVVIGPYVRRAGGSFIVNDDPTMPAPMPKAVEPQRVDTVTRDELVAFVNALRDEVQIAGSDGFAERDALIDKLEAEILQLRADLTRGNKSWWSK